VNKTKEDKSKRSSHSAKSSKSADAKKRVKADSAPKSSKSKTVKFDKAQDGDKKVLASKKSKEDVKMNDEIKDKVFKLTDIIEPVKPKKHKSHYSCFIKQKMQEVKGKTLDQNQKCTEMMKKLGEDWTKMDEKQRLPFVKLSEKDRERFDREMADFKNKGYFVDQDGVKSTDTRKMKPKFKPEVVQPKGVITPYSVFMK
jgi:hypothetical protein